MTHRVLTRWPTRVDGPLVETPLSWRGLLWTSYIAVMFYLLSNPLVFIEAIYVSILYGSWATILVLLLERGRVRLPVVPWSVLLFVGLAALSMAWSISKDDTFNTTRLTLVLAALALLITSNVSAKVLAYGIGLGGVVIVCLSVLAFRLELPGALTLQDVPRTVAGVGTNRNILAYTTLPALAAVLAIRPTARWEWPAVAVLLAVNAWGIWLAMSGTGYLAGALVVLGAVGLRLAVGVRRFAGPRGAGAVLALMVAVIAVAAVNLDRLASVVGRELDTLSGRRPLWSAIYEISDDRLFHGHGYGAVWNHPWHLVDNNALLGELYEKAGYPFAHGHNSFMDLLPDLGLLGCAALLLIYVQAIGRAVRGLVSTTLTPASIEASRLVVLVSVAHLASGLTEPLATVPFGWYVLVLAVGISLHLGSERPREATPRPVVAGEVEPTPPREADDLGSPAATPAGLSGSRARGHR